MKIGTEVHARYINIFDLHGLGFPAVVSIVRRGSSIVTRSSFDAFWGLIMHAHPVRKMPCLILNKSSTQQGS